MRIRLPFFGLVSMRNPITNLLAHYEQIRIGMGLIQEAVECCITDGRGAFCQEFSTIQAELDAVEEQATAIKRHVRNHLPRGIFLPVEKHIFFLYTRSQDDILEFGQASLQWLSMRNMVLTDDLKEDLRTFFNEVMKNIELLRPALEGTISWVNSDTITREDVKDRYWAVRKQHKLVTKMVRNREPLIYCSDMDFKDIYQVIHVMNRWHHMSRSAVSCADLLRVMIAR